MGLLWGDRPREEDTHREAVGRGRNRDRRRKKGEKEERRDERKGRREEGVEKETVFLFLYRHRLYYGN